MRKFSVLLTFLFLFLQTNILISQIRWSTESKKALKNLDWGQNAYQLKNYDEAIKSIKNALKADSEIPEAYLLLAQIYEELKEYDLAAENYQSSLGINPDLHKNTPYYLAYCLYKLGDYDGAIKHYQAYLLKEGISQKHRLNAMGYVKKAEFARHQVNNPVPFNTYSLGSKVNSEYNDYWPFLSPDEEILIFTSLRPIVTDQGIVTKRYQEDFFISKKENKVWSEAIPLNGDINDPVLNEGSPSLTIDGNIMYFTACDRDEGFGRCDIYYAKKDSSGWSSPINIGPPINSVSSEKQPSISSDGRTLYFVSNRPGGFGRLDIWKSEMNDQGEWEMPENLGGKINSKENERAPFLHHDNKTMYFTSDGHLGMGANDLFLSQLDEEKEWGEPKNLGYPINTHVNEMGMIVNAEGTRAYFATNRKNGQGNDIYAFDLPKDLRPHMTSYMKGIIFDAETKEKLGANFELYNLETGKLVSKSFSMENNGDFLISVPTETIYALHVKRKGYLFYSENFDFLGDHSQFEPLTKNIPLEPLKEGKQVVLKNVFFETNSFELKKTSESELDKIYEFLSLNPTITVEVGGYTDNQGDEQYNQQLSENRAKEVVFYLNKKGIPSDKLKFKGYGESYPVASNDSEMGRALNRRTELKILSIK